MPFAVSPAYLALLVLPLLVVGKNHTGVQHLQLRLADGWKPGTGRVEINEGNNTWKVICEEDWDINDAHVACRQLGFPRALRWYPSRVDRERPFFKGLGSCRGDESFLDQCLAGSAEDCNHVSQRDADVAVECEASVRLVGGEHENEGRVEVYIDGVWATVCGQSLDFDTANVLCEHMDFSSALELTKQSTLQGNGSVLDVACKGSFLKENCIIKHSDCSHEWDAGLVCQLYPEGAVRLFEAASPREGFIAIHHNGSWGAVCNDRRDFNLIDAGVACRQLGFGSAISVLNGEWFGQGNAVVPEFFYNHFECTGSESSLTECHHRSGSPVTCTRNEFAGVTCGDFDVTQSEISLVKESNSTPNGTGQLMLKYKAPGSSNLIARPVCFNRWDIADAQVACRQLGYKQATSTQSITGYGDYFSKGDSGWLDGLQCRGNEKALYNCLHGGWSEHNCYYSGFVAVSCSNEYPSLRIILAGGRDNAEGLLQVEYLGQRGAVCGDGWSMSAAAVACKQLGYATALRTSSGEEFGGSPSYMWMSYVTCNGSEEKLQECTHSGFGDFSKSCTHPVGVGVVCGDPPFPPPLPNWSIRLVGHGEGEGPMGRVEVFHNGQWKGLCMNDLGRSEAQAICRSLNYADGLPIVEKSAQFLGLGYSSLWMVQLSCSVSRGSDRGLDACSTIGWSPGPCRHTQPGVLCSDAPLTVQNVKLRLNGGRRKGEGIVEVGIGSAWGAVCIDHWEMHTAKLLCKHLGYKTALASVKNVPLRSKFETRDRIHFINQFRCSGKETSIDECELVWETGQCQGGRDAYAGLVCTDTEVSLPVRLVAGRNQYEGNVQLQYEGEWGYVCGEGWDMMDADVVCKQLGSVGAVKVKTFRDYSVCRVWLDQVNCMGNESSIWNCSHSGLGMFEGTCSATEYAGVECKESAEAQIDRSAPTDHIELACNLLNHPIIGVPDHSLPMRLVSFGKNSTSTGRGRVEVFSRQAWGSICDDGWDLTDANVTCRALGFEGAERIAEVEEFGKGTGHIWMDDINCVGTEISLDFCENHGPGRSDCIHSEDAGVVCITGEVASKPTAPGTINSVTIVLIAVMAVLIAALVVTILAMRLRRMKKSKKSSNDVTLQFTSSTQLQEENGNEYENDHTEENSSCGYLDTLSKQLP